MRANIALFASLTFTLLLLVLLLPLGDVFITKVILGNILLSKEGSFPLSSVGGYWSIVLLNYRPASIVEYSVLRYVTGLQDYLLLGLPIYALPTFLLIYSIGMILMRQSYYKKRKSEIEIIHSITSCIAIVYGFYYFSVSGYHALSISYLTLSIYLLLKYMFATNKPILILLAVSTTVLLLTHQYSTGILIALLSITTLGYFLLMRRIKDANKTGSRFLPVLSIMVFLEVFILPDLEVIAEMGAVDEIIQSIISGLRVTILKALRLETEVPQHLMYMSLLKEAFPIYSMSETIEGITKYLLIMLGMFFGFLSLRKHKNMTRERLLFGFMMFSFSLAILAPAAIYAVYYGALIVLTPWVLITLLTPIIVGTYMTWNGEKKTILLLKNTIRYMLLVLIIVSAVLSITARCELIHIRGRLLDASTTYLGKVFGDYLPTESTNRIFSDHTTSANLLLGLVMELSESGRAFPKSISLEPFGMLAYGLNCTHVARMPRDSILVFRADNLKYGLFGEVAQYYVPADYICFQRIFNNYSLIISTGSNIAFWMES
ncbi:MAG: hypothetical protein QXJ97_11480 [Desulfurococcaceae archaeon]